MGVLRLSAEDHYALVDLHAPNELLPEFETIRRFAIAAGSVGARWQFLWDMRRSGGGVYQDVLDAYDAVTVEDSKPWVVLATPAKADRIAAEFGNRSVAVVPMRRKPLEAAPLDLRLFEVEDLVEHIRDMETRSRPRTWALPDEKCFADQTSSLGITNDELERWRYLESQRFLETSNSETFHNSRTKFSDDVRAKQIDNLLNAVAQSSVLVQLAVHVEPNKVSIVPYHSHSVHQVTTSSEDGVLIRPGRASARYWGTFEDAIEQLEYLLNQPSIAEASIEHLLLRNPLFLRGLNFTNVYPQVILPRAGASDLRPDIIAEPADSDWAQIVDLKLPSQQVLKGRENRASLASGLTDAVSQLREYAAFFDDRKAARTVEERYGFKCYKPKLTVIVGRDPGKFTEEERRRALTAHPSLEIVTYDDLLRAARRVLLL